MYKLTSYAEKNPDLALDLINNRIMEKTSGIFSRKNFSKIPKDLIAEAKKIDSYQSKLFNEGMNEPLRNHVGESLSLANEMGKILSKAEAGLESVTRRKEVRGNMFSSFLRSLKLKKELDKPLTVSAKHGKTYIKEQVGSTDLLRRHLRNEIDHLFENEAMRLRRTKTPDPKDALRDIAKVNEDHAKFRLDPDFQQTAINSAINDIMKSKKPTYSFGGNSSLEIPLPFKSGPKGLNIDDLDLLTKPTDFNSALHKQQEAARLRTGRSKGFHLDDLNNLKFKDLAQNLKGYEPNHTNVNNFFSHVNNHYKKPGETVSNSELLARLIGDANSGYSTLKHPVMDNLGRGGATLNKNRMSVNDVKDMHDKVNEARNKVYEEGAAIGKTGLALAGIGGVTVPLAYAYYRKKRDEQHPLKEYKID